MFKNDQPLSFPAADKSDHNRPIANTGSVPRWLLVPGLA